MINLKKKVNNPPPKQIKFKKKKDNEYIQHENILKGKKLNMNWENL